MRWTLLAAGLLAMLFAAPAAADKRVALVVGNSTYQNVSRLQNPQSDVQLNASESANVALIDQAGKR